MSTAVETAHYPALARLTLREAALWGTAALAVVAAHMIAVGLYLAAPSDVPSAEAVEHAVTVQLVSLPVTRVQSVAAAAARSAEDPDVLKPVKPETLTVAEPVEPEASVAPEPVTPLAVAAPEPVAALAPIEARQPAVVPVEVAMAAPVAPDRVRAVTPETVVAAEVALSPRPLPRPRVVKRTATPAPAAAKAQPADHRSQEVRRKVARRAVERPRAETPQAVQSQASDAAPSVQGGASTAPRIDPARWQAEVIAWLNRHKRYPSVARSRRIEGTVAVAFTIDPSGRVLSARVAETSGSASLDRAAVDMVERSSPVPAPPPQIARRSLALVVPVDYRVR